MLWSCNYGLINYLWRISVDFQNFHSSRVGQIWQQVMISLWSCFIISHLFELSLPVANLYTCHCVNCSKKKKITLCKQGWLAVKIIVLLVHRRKWREHFLCYITYTCLIQITGPLIVCIYQRDIFHLFSFCFSSIKSLKHDKYFAF